MNLPLVGFAGMTHLGINSAAATAARGFPVLGYDADATLIGRLRRGDLPLSEPSLDDYFRDHAALLSFTDDAAELTRCDIVYIAADVPTDDDAVSDLTPILGLIDRVQPVLKDQAILVILCQVPPGFTRGLRSVPPDRLLYQVETLIFGRAIERAMFPERFIVGCADPSRPLPPAYRQLLDSFQCPIQPMRYESAELTKISINFCLVASVSTANMLAEISEAVGADWAEIVPALKLDKRIGPHAYLAPGLGISGGNLERDLQTILRIGGDKGTDIGIIQAWRANSRHRKDWLWRTLQKYVLRDRPDARIAILGLAYKENTDSTKNSPALQLLSHLADHPFVRYHDPVVVADRAPCGSASDSPIDCAQGADVLILATAWPEYRALSLADLAAAMRGRVLIDPYRLFDGSAAKSAGFAWYALGVPASC
jgi:UDPglucose 6-dehydrogenase